jgi:pimeloyl-ACP methyl ester carboxylesterase
MTVIETHVTTDDGVRLFAQILGEGPQVVLIPNGYYLFDALSRFEKGRTLVFFDPRNRGRSDAITDRSKLERGIRHDVDDLDAIRRHLGAARVDVIGHSYMGVTAALYAMNRPDRTGRVVQIDAAPGDPSKQYPAHLTNVDGTLRDVFTRIGELQKERSSMAAVEFCRRFWAILRELYVLHPSDAARLAWEPCHLPNEGGFMKQYTDFVLPSIQALNLSDADYARATAPVLAIHGRQDRSAPYGGGREWALRLPNARLITVENAAHVPWIEEPDEVFGAIGAFLGGAWPADAEAVESLD